jgi:pilus assembly protein Flp/PilA
MLSRLRPVPRAHDLDLRDRGASAVEYGLMVAAIAAVIVAVVFGLGSVVKNAFTSTSASIAACPTNTSNCGG